MTSKKRKPARWDLAAAVTFLGDEQNCAALNRMLNSDELGRLKIGRPSFEKGEYVLPITDRETGATHNIQVPESVRDISSLQRYFKEAVSPLAPAGEIADLVGKPAREAWEGVLELRKRYGNPKEMQTHFEFNTQDGLIHGSELRTLILLNKYLAGRNARTLTFQEGMEEDRKGKLSNGVWRDFGVAVYSSSNPYKELAETLIGESNRRNWKLPLLVHPASLELSDNGIGIYFAKDFSPELIVSGEQAREELKRFYWIADSGARRLTRGRDGSWSAYWVDVFDSGAVCRVDKVRGVAATRRKIRKE